MENRKRKRDNQFDVENHRPSKRTYTKSHSSQGSISLSSDSSYSQTVSSSTSSPSVSSSSTTNHSSISPNQENSSSSDFFTSNVDYDSEHLNSPPNSVPQTSYSTAAQYTPITKSKIDDTKQLPQTQNPTASASKCILTSSHDLRLNPIPEMTWTDSGNAWKIMCRKDDKASLDRKPEMLRYYPGLQPRMRAILLDWLNEVWLSE